MPASAQRVVVVLGVLFSGGLSIGVEAGALVAGELVAQVVAVGFCCAGGFVGLLGAVATVVVGVAVVIVF